MGVDVDPAGQDVGAVGVNLSGAMRVDVADLDDATTGHRDVGGPRFGAGAVDDGAAADDEIRRAHALTSFDVSRP